MFIYPPPEKQTNPQADMDEREIKVEEAMGKDCGVTIRRQLERERRERERE